MKAYYCWFIATACLLLMMGTASTDDDEIVLEDFRNPVHTWKQMNDPVMGGRSTGSFRIQDDGVGVFQGQVVNVPFLHAPGFIQARTIDRRIPFPNVSLCSALQLEVRSNNPEYAGYRVSFGNAHAPGGKMFAYGYKANLVGVTSDFGKIVIPFSDFTDYWDDATGDPIKTCRENQLYCPDEATLRNMKTIAVWGEGVAGNVSLEIASIRAVNCHQDEQQQHIADSSRRYRKQLLRGLSNQWSLSTLFLNRFWT